MTFGPFPDEHCFYIEKSATYQKIREGGVKMAEFLLLRFNNGSVPSIWVVEAKSSAPKPTTQPDFDIFVREIQDKLNNALSLGLALYLKRHRDGYEELPTGFTMLTPSSIDVRFVLIVKRQQEEWFPPLQEALNFALKPTIKIWSLSDLSVLVINEELAKSYGLIRAEE